MKTVVRSKFMFFLSFLLFFISCKNPGETSYQNLLANGVTLSANDTTTAIVGTQLFFTYNFSAGVQPIYYTLSYLNSDSTIVQYVNEESFYLDDDDVDGGRSVGVHVFEGLKEGLARIEFYNPYYNKEAYQNEFQDHWSSDRVIMEFYKVFSDSSLITSWEENDYVHFYEEWDKAGKEEKEAIWEDLYANWNSLEFPYDSLQLANIMNRFAERYAIRKSPMHIELLDSLFNMNPLYELEQWREQLNAYQMVLPLHKTLKTSVCYIKIKN